MPLLVISVYIIFILRTFKMFMMDFSVFVIYNLSLYIWNQVYTSIDMG